ncbi:MAG: hypothetical protein NZT61_01850 [Deltaproteobacteria bacterium]|nr:hypothetical protein [Deltaproteobacteria bacterium]
MTDKALYVVGVGHSYGDVVLTNDFIESLDIGTTSEWIMEKIGISQRRITLPLEYIAKERNENPEKAEEICSKNWVDLAVEACNMAFSRAKISKDLTGLLLLDCVTPRNFFPPPSHELKRKLGINGLAVDIVTACPAVALHGFFVANLNQETLPEVTLSVTSSTVTHAVNYNDRTDGAIWGDGSASMVIVKKSFLKKVRFAKVLRIVDASFDADTTRANSVVIERRGHFRQDGRAVRNFSVRQTVRLIRDAQEKHGLDFSRDIFIGHQANYTMLRQIAEATNIPENNHWKNVSFCGNQAAAGALASLSENWERIRPGQKILIAVLGAGLSWGTLVLQAEEL